MPSQDVIDLVTQGRSLYFGGKFAQAAARFEAALQRDEDNIAAHQYLAGALHSQGVLSEALEHYWSVQRLSYPPLPAMPSGEVAEIRAKMVEGEAVAAMLLNRERKQRAMGICVPDPRLARIARQHSEEMRDLNYFSHTSPQRGFRGIADRYKREFGDVRRYSIAENIARRYSRSRYSLSVDSMHDTHEQWMNSPGHRRNILDARFDHVGIGIAVNDSGDYWVTQFFAKL